MSYYYETRVSPRGLYRTRDGYVAGVCGGIADYFDLSSFWIRLLMAGFIFFTGLFPGLFVYILLALVMKKEPYYSY